ncbi:TonB-dependent receptor plug domain-containing protein [Formicincola oecophyllae]|uniref:TonB-dependent receptor plug domain-containing protein n=1 Tax=Formicincola oecophyllae TaxID=2558361 RepID=A0A4Y6UA48_9PROT|nr:TonB-dependent receptor [Formicincola oecophyllae]QDH13458.1 TonB-dependent receptor plug domain-containing protein [Formicincola oecophyllae]
MAGVTLATIRAAKAAPAAKSHAVQQQGGAETIVTRSHLLRNIIGGGLLAPQNGVQEKSAVGQPYISIQAPTANAFQLVQNLPGANVASSDPYGMSPQTTISIHGLGGDEIGYVLEGIPMGDAANYGGTPDQFADAENYAQVAIQQGASDLDSPVVDSAGGLMSMTYLDPSFKRGGMASFSYGSWNGSRGFIRLETGEIGSTGIRGFVSYSNTHSDNWRGPGTNSRQHVDFKFLKEWGQSRVSFLGSWNKTDTAYLPKTTLAGWREDGIHSGELARHYDAANPEKGAQYWKLWRDPEQTLYLGAPAHVELGSGFSLDIKPYAQGAMGNWPSADTLEDAGLPSGPHQSPVVREDWTQKTWRSGVTTSAHYQNRFQGGHNDAFIGYWYDYVDDSEKMPYTAVDSQGRTPNPWSLNNHHHMRDDMGQVILGANYHTITQTNAIFIGDHLSLLGNRLLIDAGFKEVMMTRQGTDGSPSQAGAGYPYHVGQSVSEPLPRFGMRWKITKHDQIFLNATTNFRLPAVTAYYNADSSHGMKPEYSISEAIGYRHDGEWLAGSLTFFNYNFTNRQITTYENAASTIATSMNAGGQTSRGLDFEIGTKPWHHLSPFASAEYLNATTDNNMCAAYAGGKCTAWLPTKGKSAIRSPHFIGALGLRYDDGHLFGMITARYVGRQYSTFLNDQHMPGYATADLSLGYRFDDVKLFRDSGLKRPTIMLNIINLSNQNYLSGVGSPQLNAHSARATNGVLVKGHAPKYYVDGGFTAMGTVQTAF